MSAPNGPTSVELQQIYRERFQGKTDYRGRVWDVLTSYFSKWVPKQAHVLDLGAGYCEFINRIEASTRYAMDLNPDTRTRAHPSVQMLEQDCSETWRVPAESLDIVFTSNFLEHLPNKQAVSKTLLEALRCLKPGGRFIAMGPNIKYVPGEYWDFFDHYVALTEMSLAEAATSCGFTVESAIGRFLPYTMATGPQYPIWMLKLYLACPPVWPMFGKQFLVVVRK